MAINEGSSVEAAVDLLSIAELFPTSERAPQALYTMGVGAFANDLYVESADALQRAQVNYPDYRWDAVGYWLGRAQAAKGDRTAAEATWQALVNARTRHLLWRHGGPSNASTRRHRGLGGQFGQIMQAIAGPASRVPGMMAAKPLPKQWLAQWLAVDAVNLRATSGRLLPKTLIGCRAKCFWRWMSAAMALAALERVYSRNQNDSSTLYALSLEFERLQAYRLSLMAMARLLAV